MSSDLSPEVKETLFDTVVGAASGAVTGAAELVVTELTSNSPIDGVVEGVVEGAALGAAAGLAKNMMKGAAKAMVTRSMKKAVGDKFHNALCTINDTVSRVTENLPSPPELATLMYYRVAPETQSTPKDPIWNEKSEQEFLKECSADREEDPSVEDSTQMDNVSGYLDTRDLGDEGYDWGCKISPRIRLFTFYNSALPIEFEESTGRRLEDAREMEEIETDYFIEEEIAMMNEMELVRQLLVVLYHVGKIINRRVHFHNIVLIIEHFVDRYGGVLVSSRHLDVRFGSAKMRISSCPAHCFQESDSEVDLLSLYEFYEDVLLVPRVVKLTISLMKHLNDERRLDCCKVTKDKESLSHLATYYSTLIGLIEDLVANHRACLFKNGRRASLYIPLNATLLSVKLNVKIGHYFETFRELFHSPKQVDFQYDAQGRCCIYRFHCLICRKINTSFFYINYSSRFCLASAHLNSSKLSHHVRGIKQVRHHFRCNPKPAEILADHALQHFETMENDARVVYGIGILHDFGSRDCRNASSSPRIRKSLVELYRWLYTCSPKL